jgi:predicted dehydrogenase
MSKLRVGVIGAGWWATFNHMPQLASRKDVELVAVCRLGKDLLEKIQQQFEIPFATEDYRKLLEQDLDAVIVSTPHHLHHQHAGAALRRGLHVLCEKPMCTRANHARELVRLAREKRLHLLVPYGWHYKAFVLQAKRWLDAGAIGTVQFVLCHMASPIRSLLMGQGFAVEDNSGQAGDVLFQPDPRTWADPVVAGGGYGHAQLSHSTGMLFWLTGLVPESAYALMTAPGSRVDLYDAVSVRFAGGAIGTVSGAGTVPPSGMTAFQVDLRLFGSEGMLLLDCERARLELRRHDGRQESLELAADAGAYSCEGPPHNFIDLIVGNTTENLSPGESAMHSVALLDAAYRSAVSGAVERCET